MCFFSLPPRTPNLHPRPQEQDRSCGVSRSSTLSGYEPVASDNDDDRGDDSPGDDDDDDDDDDEHNDDGNDDPLCAIPRRGWGEVGCC